MALNQTPHHSKTEVLEKSWVSQIWVEFNPFQPFHVPKICILCTCPSHHHQDEYGTKVRLGSENNGWELCFFFLEPRKSVKWYGCFRKWWVSPQISHFSRVFHYKPSMLGYPYFWKHPYLLVKKKDKHLIPTSQRLMSRSSYLSKCLGSRSSPILGCESPVWNSSFSRRD